jgi:energy-coupling factor transport system substrate-specific component
VSRLQHVALGATIGTLAALSRIPFAVIPNVQPASALVILAGAVLGARVGVLAGVVVPLVSNALLGHGPWSLFQAIGWGGMGAGAALLGARPRRWLLAAYGALAGLAFGVLMDAWVWLAGVRPLALRTLLPVLVRGIPFNLAHAAGNAAILWLVGPRLATLLRRARDRRRVTSFEDAAETTPTGGQAP